MDMSEGSVNINSRNQYGTSPLYNAIKNKEVENVEYLLKHGAFVKSGDVLGSGEDYLHLAVKIESEVIVKMILNKGANVNGIALYGRVPLHIACEEGYSRIVVDLLKHGAYVNFACTTDYWREGYTPLHFAALKGSEEVVKILLSNGANTNTKSKDNQGHEKNVKLHGANIDVQAQYMNGMTTLHFAVKTGCFEIVEIILQRGADINASNNDGYTALHFTAELKCNNKNYPSPIAIDTHHINEKIVKLLLENGANVDAQDKNGMTILHLVVRIRCFAIVEILLQSGADVNVSDKYGRTALSFTAGDDDIFKWRTINDDTRDNKVDIAELLLSMGANANAKIGGTTTLHIATRKCNRNIVELLIKYGAEVNSKDIKKLSSLHIAAENCYLEMVMLLLKYGAEINDQDECGITALHLASKKGNFQMVVHLLEYGADINLISKDNKTPLDFVNYGMRESRFESQRTTSSFRSIENQRTTSSFLSCEKVYEILKQHIIKMNIANLYLNYRNLIFTEIVENSFHAKCKKEIESMKNEKVGNICINDILVTNNISQLVKYAKQENIRESFKSNYCYKYEFPLYYHMINNKFKKGMERYELIEQGIINYSELPYICVEKILSYLSNEDLRNFIRGTSSQDDCSQ